MSLGLKNFDKLYWVNTMQRHSKVTKIPKIRVNYGSGWVGPGLILKKKKLSENRPKIALYQYWYFGVVYIMCILFV